MGGLWRNSEETREGKYLVQRRDGTIPEWPWFVLGARDPAAPAALRAYAEECERLGMDMDYVRDIQRMALAWIVEIERLGVGDPDAPRHREDDPETVTKMRKGLSA